MKKIDPMSNFQGNTGDFDAGRGIIGKRTNEAGEMYRKGNTFAWPCTMGWAVAELIRNRYTGHRYHDQKSAMLDDVASAGDSV